MDKEEDILIHKYNDGTVSAGEITLRHVFAGLYRNRSEDQPRRLFLVGPVGERPLHVFLLRAGGMEAELREGLLQGVKYLTCLKIYTSTENLKNAAFSF